MSMNSRFAVAIHILALLAIKEEPLTSKYIACSLNTNPVVVRRLLGLLAKAGLVETQLGVEGGSTLARPPQQITLLQLYRLVEPGDLFPLHPSQPDPLCPCGRTIQPVLSAIFRQAETAMAEILSQATLAGVVAEIETQLKKIGD
jgi:Rrf2 family protein